MPLKQSFCTPCFTDESHTLDDVCAEAARLGYIAAEWWGRDDTQFAEQVACVQRHGLIVVSICGHASLGEGLNDPAQHDRIEAELRESIDLAVAHSIPGLICFSGNRRPGVSDDEGIAMTAQGLRRVAEYAEEKGINLNIELLNSKIDHAGYQADHTAWGVAVCEAVNSPRVKLLYDIYHMQIMEGDVIRTIRENIQWIGHFHTAGNPGRHDLDTEQELNYPAICRAIAEAGYEGYLGHEFTPKGDPLDALSRAFDTCRIA